MPKLLIAEDDADLCNLLTDELSEAGFSVTATRNGGEAIVAAVENHFDVILLDMMLPGMDGIQVIRVLKKIMPQIPIVGLTGYVGRGYMVQASDFGVVCLSKPIAINDLIKELHEAIKVKH